MIDNQLPIHLADWLRGQGHNCEHVAELGLDESTDLEVWTACQTRHAVLVTKDEDFVYLANRSGDRGRLVWVRLGNCRNKALIDAFQHNTIRIDDAIRNGQRIIELRD